MNRLKSKFVKYFYDELIMNQKDIKSLSLLQKYLPDSYFPFTSSSLNPHSLLCYINNLIMCKRKSVLEFGGGISTIVSAKVIKANKLSTNLVVVDNDSSYIKILQDICRAENIDNIITFIYAPIKSIEIDKSKYEWYDNKIIKEELRGHIFDLILVDGPLAHKKYNRYNRFPAIRYIRPLLEENYSIYLDDVNRYGERRIIKQWSNELNIDFEMVNSSFAHISKGMFFNTIL